MKMSPSLRCDAPHPKLNFRELRKAEVRLSPAQMPLDRLYGCLCRYLNLGTLHRYFEIYNAFGFSHLIAYTTIVSLGQTVDTNAHVNRISLGCLRLHVRRIEVAV